VQKRNNSLVNAGLGPEMRRGIPNTTFQPLHSSFLNKHHILMTVSIASVCAILITACIHADIDVELGQSFLFDTGF
jgi:hypothetical protein